MPNKLKKYSLKMKKKHLKIINKMGLLRKKIMIVAMNY
jgi:hypothetical protein